MSIENSPTWTLTDGRASKYGFPNYSVASHVELRGILESISRKEPRFLHMESSSGLVASIAIGGSLGSVVTFSPTLQSVRIVSASQILTNERRFFAGDYQQSSIFPQPLLRVEEVIEIVIEIFRTNEIPNWVEWE